MSGHGIFLLFERGKRPDSSAIKNFANGQIFTTLTYDPADGDAPQNPQSADEALWVELLRDGLTFDLHGLSPGDGLLLPEVTYRYDDGGLAAPDTYETIRLSPGPHLAGSEGSLPVVKCLVSLARDLTLAFNDVVAIVWPPAKSLVGRRYFESTATAWLDGGPFPALSLTSFKEMDDGGFQSVGLAYILGFELWADAGVVSGANEAMRLGLRLVNHLIVTGAIEESELVTGLDGASLTLERSKNRRYVRVRRA